MPFLLTKCDPFLPVQRAALFDSEPCEMRKCDLGRHSVPNLFVRHGIYPTKRASSGSYKGVQMMLMKLLIMR